MADKILIFRACLEQKICFKPYIGQPEDAIRTLPGGVSHFPFSVYYYYCASFMVRYEVSSTSRHTNHEWSAAWTLKFYYFLVIASSFDDVAMTWTISRLGRARTYSTLVGWFLDLQDQLHWHTIMFESYFSMLLSKDAARPIGDRKMGAVRKTVETYQLLWMF